MNHWGIRRGLVHRTTTLVVASALLIAQSGPVFAQTDEERAGARAAATEGAQAFKDGKWTDAIDLFTRAESLVHAPPHVLYLARSQARVGQLVKAQENYNKIVREKIDATAPKAFRDAQAEAVKEAQELEPRIPSVKVVVHGDGKNIKVTQDGVLTPPALVGLQRPVDPGEHRWQAGADGMASDVVTLTIREGAKESVTLTLKASATPIAAAGPALPAPAPSAPAAPAAPESPPTSSAPPPPAHEAAAASSGGGGTRTAAFIGFGVGAVGLGAAVAFALKASSTHSKADDLYNNTYHCDVPGNCVNQRATQLQGLNDDANTAKRTANLALVVGGVGIVAGVTLLLLSTGSKSESATGQAPAITPWVGFGSAGLAGQF